MGHSKLYDLLIRNNTHRSTECSALLSDIIAKFQDLNKTETVPFLCCDVAGLSSRMPIVQIKELNDIAIVNRN